MCKGNYYHLAQSVIADLKAAIFSFLRTNADRSFTNVEIGRSLGIYSGHVGHEGHISRTLLAMMEEEGIIKQDAEKKWHLINYID